MIKQYKFTGMSVLLLLLSFNVNALELRVEFSAEAIQVSPDRPPLMSKMYVSKSAVRTEMVQQGHHVTDISYLKKGKRLLIYPDQKTYMEQTGLSISPSWSDKSVKTPCEGVPNLRCKKIDKESLHNINVDKWEVVRDVNGKKFKSLHWIDSKRHLAIKDMFPDGGMSELIMLGKGKLDGREVEQWESRYTHPSGRTLVSKQWYDPQLQMVIKEERPGGFIRELKNIKVSKQDKKLFDYPKGFRKISANQNNFNPQGQQSQGQQQLGQRGQ